MATETYELAISGLDLFAYRETVLHFSGVGVASADTLAAGESLIAGFRANLENIFLGALPNTYCVLEYQARRATPKPSAVAVQNFDTFVLAGTRANPQVAQQLAPAVFLVPTMGNKSGGKIFWPSIASGDVVNNTYLAAFKTNVAAFIVAAQTGFTTSGITWTLCIFSRKLLTTSVVTGFHFSPVLGYQKARRNPPGGRSRKKRHHP